jgi:hypothetical protein
MMTCDPKWDKDLVALSFKSSASGMLAICDFHFALPGASVKQMKPSKFVHSIWERMRNDFYWVALKHAGEVFCPNIGLNHVDTYPRAAFPSVFP